MITYGTNPGMGLGISKSIPESKDVVEGEETYAKSLGYMGSR
jgi:3-isopropylmalate/(R)-2-methylmalate dehydratase large subunit